MSDVKKMPTMTLYAIYDEKAKKFGSFMFSDTKENAVRQYLQMIANTPFYLDFSLYKILEVNPFTEIDSSVEFNVVVDGLLRYFDVFENVTPTIDEINAYRELVIKFEQLLNKR